MCVFSWNFLNFLELWVDILKIVFGKLLAVISSSISSALFSLFSFWDSSYQYVRPLDVDQQLLQALFFLSCISVWVLLLPYLQIPWEYSVKSIVVPCFLQILKKTQLLCWNILAAFTSEHSQPRAGGRSVGMCHFQTLDITRDLCLQIRTQNRSALWVTGLPSWWSLITRMAVM